jgi:peptide/nickel transport system substrate-binding protein
MRRAQRHETAIAFRPRFASAARRRVALGCVGLLTLAVAAAGCGTHGKTGTGNTPINGRMVTYALPANVTPNYIFPFAGGADFTIVNLDNLQYFLYRPLYWFGDQGLPYLNEKLSLAYKPQYSGQVVTIKMKPNLHWSNGELITAKDLMFWINMSRDPQTKTAYGGYVPNGFPDNIKDARAVGQYEVKITIKGKYSPLWFTYNELSQFTPMPQAWDETGPNAPSHCSDSPSDCKAVYDYLSAVSAKTSSWTTSPLWKVVDGPWKLTGYTPAPSVLTFSYNTSYSLPVPAHHIAVFREIPFTSEQAEFNQLQAGGSNTIDVGYLPTVDAPLPQPGQAVGQNPVGGYALDPVYTWGLSYIPYNFDPADPQVAIFNQQYFREAFQLLVNQAAIIQGALHGYGKISTGPVGDSPQTKFLSTQAKKGDPFPFNLPAARKLLRDHGWTLNPRGVSRCTDPGSGPTQCGKDVKAGANLSFTMLFASGNAWVQSAVLQLKSNASLVGMNISLSSNSFNNVLGTVIGDCGPKAVSPCPWELADWGEGWSYVPDYLPTGDELFGTGSIGNLGHYSNATNDAKIQQTLDATSTSEFLQTMYSWQDWLTQKLPVVLQPTAPAYLLESINSLHIGSQSPTLALTPEDWYYVH